MRFSVLAVVLVAGCGSGVHRTTYRQSAFPTTPAFSPVEDAPHTVGQPGYVGEPEKAPRGTDRRVLPPTREPGIWASDRPRPVAPPVRTPGEPIPNIRVLDVPVPHHDDARDAWETTPTEQCAGANENVLMAGSMDLAHRALRLSRQQRECLVALAQVDCLKDIQQGVSAAFAGERTKSPILPWIAKALEAAEAWAEKACEGQEQGGEIGAILKGMERGNRGGTSWKH